MKIILILCGISALYKGTFSQGPVNLLPDGQQVTITPAEENVSKFVNESYHTSCLTQDGLNRAHWFNSQDQKVDVSTDNRIRVETEHHGVELYFTGITTEDAGQYTCRSNSSSASFILEVIRPIVFDTNLAEQSAPEGFTYKMKCVAQSHSKPKIFWKVNSKMPKPPKYEIMKDGLLIHNVSQQDGKVNYVCRAMDINSPKPDVKSMNITLKIKIRPQLVRNSKTEHWGVLGERANLTCAVVAYPPPTFEWVHRNKSLNSSDEILMVNDINVSILQVLVRSETTFGVYTCKARNDLGLLNHGINLSEAQKPPTPFLEPEVIGQTTAKIRVKLRNRESDGTEEVKRGKILPIVGYVVQYQMATEGDWMMGNTTKYDGGFILNGLTPQVRYNVRAASKNKASIGHFSQPLRFITLKDEDEDVMSWWARFVVPNLFRRISALTSRFLSCLQ